MKFINFFIAAIFGLLTQIVIANTTEYWVIRGGCAGAAAMGTQLQQDPDLKRNLMRRVINLREAAKLAGPQALALFESGMNFEINRIKEIYNSNGKNAAYSAVDESLWGLCPR